MNSKIRHHFVFCSILLILIACNSDYTPKPRGYFRIDFPEHAYQLFNSPGFPYSFEYPVYGNILRDTAFFGDKPENPYWINIDFPRFRARIYISYKNVDGNYDKLREDAYKMTYKHTYKASSIEDSLISTPLGIHGIFFNVGGNAATAKQFFVSDSTKHFLRGALYFDTTPNSDSLSIVNSFLQEDMYHLINTLRWKN
ncbi:MAG TPA: gliding motility lipoprotein GldD [Puia sp.]|nr:gliding motility lipoprotein GldD [Puia sp.]